MKKGIFTGLIVAATGISAALYCVTLKKLMKIALDREAPKIIEKKKSKLTASSSELSSAMERILNASQKLKEQNLKTVEITGCDSIRLVGHLYLPENPHRIIIAMHGWRSCWSQDFGIISDFLQSSNSAVLYAEQRAQGKSGGEYMGFGLLERYDCYDWIKWVSKHFKLPIFLCGVSMGASTVLMTAGFDLPQNVRGIIADCGFTSPNEIWKYVAQNNLHIPYGIYSAIVRDVCRRKIDVKSDSYSCIEAMQNCKVPVLFIHGTEDSLVPIEMTYENYKACKAPKELFIVPGAEHGMSYIFDKQGYENAVTNFLNKYSQ